MARNTASGLVNAATRSLVNGTDFGDNLMAALPDIIGQTIGSLVAGKISGGGKQSAGEKALLAEAQQSANAPIGAAASGVAAEPAVTLTPEARIALAEAMGDISSSQAEDMRARVAVERAYLKASYRDAYAASVSGSSGAATTPQYDANGLPYLQTTENGYQIDMGMLNGLEAQYGATYSSGNFSNDPLAQARDQQVRAAFQDNRDLIKKWDTVADREINKFLFISVGAPTLLAAGAAVAPVVAGYAGSFFISGSTASTLASGGAGFVTGGTFGTGFEFTKNRAFGLQDTAGGYTSAFVGGGLGGTGLRLLPTGYLATSLGQAANRGLVGALSGVAGEYSGQLVTAGGDRSQIDASQILLQGGIGATLGAALPDVRWNGVTAGRNSPVAIYTGLQTRLNSGNIGRFQVGYATNAGAANAVKGIYGQGAGAAVDGVIKRAASR